MIRFEHFVLDNGLKVYVHEDPTSPMATVNILYNVGSRDEDAGKTGFAHLFEHLMFGGSRNIPSYDEPLQKVGGENNAFTSPDITNYYITLPSANLETAFWLESDRMLGLSFDPTVLDVQQKVVIEEFKQRYLNQPYGDVWLKLRPLAYQVHPYQWATIGKDISHIETATMDDVKHFFYTHYLPNNATMVVGGNVTLEQVKQLSKKWFEPIPAGKVHARNLPQEPIQTEARFLETVAEVPLNALYKVYHMPGRFADNYYCADLLSDVLGRGKSSRLYQKLLKEHALFTGISAHSTGSLDPGLLVISGSLNQGVSLEEADAAIESVVNEIISQTVPEDELAKVKNQAEATLVFSEVELLNRAMNLAYAANAGNADWVNQETERIQAITPDDIQSIAQKLLRKENRSTLYYRAA
ncbi:MULTISPECIES: M16 family metallopeptidase [Larkinella]|uniref:Insulinase family protein n=2 Tax=Larkinella TaxID=332157 RepID=A0A5N1JNZ0_9BACT|nr:MULTISPECIES: pitrilysin family protein [Larkinella]KAA9354897.1 insulinase family protein [Larkinella humicola]RCR71593.1 insulinase family protein [Larkinella punicea]